MPYKVRLEKFEGPLDLLLQLIESEELPITEVSLAEVAEQYVAHLQAIEEKNPEELADFLLVAAKLLLIKSRVLLPSLDLNLEEDGISLEDQLKLYKEYAQASKTVQAIIGKRAFSWPRQKAPLQAGIFTPPKGLNPGKLAAVFRDILRALAPVSKLPGAAISRAISIKEKIEELRRLILSKAQINFSQIMRGAKSKTEVIVSFLALLELIKQKIVNVSQKELFEDISVKRI
ncbi:segregation/condensation protein A [Candidatus Uhrbacteria bacterium]|nr:segregation/condensation protein A [Candidatus Uhrbacteria bacterium]